MIKIAHSRLDHYQSVDVMVLCTVLVVNLPDYLYMPNFNPAYGTCKRNSTLNYWHKHKLAVNDDLQH